MCRIVTLSEQTMIERVPKYILSVLYYTRDQNKHSKRCNFCSSKARHKIERAKFLEKTSLTIVLNYNIFLII